MCVDGFHTPTLCSASATCRLLPSEADGSIRADTSTIGSVDDDDEKPRAATAAAAVVVAAAAAVGIVGRGRSCSSGCEAGQRQRRMAAATTALIFLGILKEVRR